jgi:hypothetical protein
LDNGQNRPTLCGYTSESVSALPQRIGERQQ